MKTQKAIEWLKAWSATHQNENENVREAVWSGIQALKEIEQYRALGTVEELKEAREKQVAKKPTDIDEDANTFVCPSCGHTLIALDDMTVHQHCLICGKALKWGEEDDWEEGGTSD